jgi:glutathione S-transferase
MKMKLWHCHGARSLRPLWAMEEMQLPYEVELLRFPPRFFKKDFLAINPLGTVHFSRRQYYYDGIKWYLPLSSRKV